MSKRMDRLSASPKLTTGLAARAAIEGLEARQMLTGTPGAADQFVLAQWGDGFVESRAGSYLVEFDGYVGKQQAELLAREVATRLGVTFESSTAFGLGRYADLKVDGMINAFDAAALVGKIPHLKGVEPDRK